MKARGSESGIESAVVGMYSSHPSPSTKDKLGFASRRMELRLHSCGITAADYVGKQVLDAGCGTGEYSSWFASRGAHVTGIDLSDGSLREARNYVAETGLERVRFEKRSVLETGFPDTSFDLVYCTGVLHHTPDPLAGFTELCRLLRADGKILISLYNSVGFLPRETRRQIAKFLGGDDLDRRVLWGRRLFRFKSKQLLKRAQLNDKESALYDYFAIPHETRHSVGEVLGWFDRLGIEFVGSFAPTDLGDYLPLFAHKEFNSMEKKFRPRLAAPLARLGSKRTMRRRRPGPGSRLAVQSLWLLSGIVVFAMCGRKT